MAGDEIKAAELAAGIHKAKADRLGGENIRFRCALEDLLLVVEALGESEDDPACMNARRLLGIPAEAVHGDGTGAKVERETFEIGDLILAKGWLLKVRKLVKKDLILRPIGRA